MKRIGRLTVLAVLFSLPVALLAQDAKPGAAKPAPAPAQPAAKPAAAAAQPAAKPEAPAAAPTLKMAADTPRRSRSNEDARKCLELTTNIDIHKCAEPYR
jgi:hypothetical protein